MTRSKLPSVFRVSVSLLVAAIVVGGWWQPQSAGPRGRAFLAVAARTCPAAVAPSSRPTVADTARVLDRWTYLTAADLILRDGPRRCAAGRAR